MCLCKKNAKTNPIALSSLTAYLSYKDKSYCFVECDCLFELRRQIICFVECDCLFELQRQSSGLFIRVRTTA